MIQSLLWIITALLLVNLTILVLVLKRLLLTKKDRDELRFFREDLSKSEKAIKDEIRGSQQTVTNTVTNQLENVRNTVDTRFKSLLEGNESKLDQIRQTVDEKLQSTLEKRLGESFKIVSERLEAVQRRFGEMRNLAKGVDDLQRVLTNVRTRGIWGEYQLGTLLEEILTPDQYGTNVKLREDAPEMVEYAVRLPGNDYDKDSCIWLPIDSKFPLGDYEKLVEASDADTEQEATQALIRTVRTEAKKIQEKYIYPPNTTEFAVMFLPTEGLYAEVLRIPALVTELMQLHRIVVTGPTTLAAFLNSLRVGFKTLAIEKHTSEVWDILAAVKTEFGKFGNVLATLKRQVNTVSRTIDEVGVRRRAMDRKLRDVDELSQEEASERLGLSVLKNFVSEDNVDN